MYCCNRGDGIQLRSTVVLLLLIAFCSSTVVYSLLVKSEAYGLSGTGIGIVKEGPLEAEMGETIEYTIIVYNLGDFWIRNVTLTDTFPNGTSCNWVVPDLAPLNHTGNSFNISGILYTIGYDDVAGCPLHIQNHAEVEGYLDWYGLYKHVSANTDYPTLVTIPPPPPVGGYSVSIKTTYSSASYALYITMFLMMSVIFTSLRSQTVHIPNVQRLRHKIMAKK